MVSSRDAASNASAMQPSSHAMQLSFPPTQKSSLLDSSTPRLKTSMRPRSLNQRTNLMRSWHALEDVLSSQTLKHAAAV